MADLSSFCSFVFLPQGIVVKYRYEMCMNGKQKMLTVIDVFDKRLSTQGFRLCADQKYLFIFR